MSELVNPNDLEKQEDSNGIPSVAAGKKNKQKDLNKYISKCILGFALVVGLIALAYALLTVKGANASSEVQDPDRKHLRVEDITSTKALTMPAMPPKDEEKDDEDELSLFSESSPKSSAVSLSADNGSNVSVGGNGSSVNGLTPLHGGAGFVEHDEMSLEDLAGRVDPEAGVYIFSGNEIADLIYKQHRISVRDDPHYLFVVKFHNVLLDII